MRAWRLPGGYAGVVEQRTIPGIGVRWFGEIRTPDDVPVTADVWQAATEPKVLETLRVQASRLAALAADHPEADHG
jgi:hypothetical protein